MTELSPIRVAGRRAGGIVPAILCGGSGTRLWPVSRQGLRQAACPDPRRRLAVPAHARGGSPAGTFADADRGRAAGARFLAADQAARGRRRDRARARAGGARHAGRGDARRACLAERRDPSAIAAGAALRPPDPGRRRLRRGGRARGGARRPTAASSCFGLRADRPGHRLRLHRARRARSGGGAPRSRASSRSPTPARAAAAGRRGLPLERRHVLLPRRRRPARDRARWRPQALAAVQRGARRRRATISARCGSGRPSPRRRRSASTTR